MRGAGAKDIEAGTPFKQHKMQPPNSRSRQEQTRHDDQLLPPITNNNNIIIDSDTENLKEHQKGGQSSRKAWLLLIAAMLSIFLCGLLVALMASSLLDRDDQCYDSHHFNQHPSSHRLFGTKTAYSIAYQALRIDDHQLVSSQQHQQSQLHQSQHLALPNQVPSETIKDQQTNLVNQPPESISIPLKIKPQLPSFYQNQPLQEIDKRLRVNEHCRLRQFYYFGRHAARFPGANDIQSMAKLVGEVQRRIEPAKFQPASARSSTATHSPVASESRQNPQASPKVEQLQNCSNPLLPYKKWSSFLLDSEAKQANLLMDSGFSDTDQIARRLKYIYPEAFDGFKSRIEFGTTKELRTAQTALPFVRHMDNFRLDSCDISKFPTFGPKDQAQAEQILNSECYRDFLRSYTQEKLSFHKTCRDYAKENIVIPKLELKAANRTEFIASSVSKKLKLTDKSSSLEVQPKARASDVPDGQQNKGDQKSQELSVEETRALYKLCRFESSFLPASAQPSIWCNLFQDSELEFYEFLDDIDDFYNQAYFFDYLQESTCPVTSDLMRKFKEVASGTNPSLPSLESHFYFSHAEVIQRLFAATVDLRKDPAFTTEQLKSLLDNTKLPERRQFRSALISPFSANLAFALYECDKPLAEVQQQSGPLKPGPNFYVVASNNERPIQIDGCSGPICDLDTLLESSNLNTVRKCNLEDICRTNYVMT